MDRDGIEEAGHGFVPDEERYHGKNDGAREAREVAKLAVAGDSERHHNCFGHSQAFLQMMNQPPTIEA